MLLLKIVGAFVPFSFDDKQRIYWLNVFVSLDSFHLVLYTLVVSRELKRILGQYSKKEKNLVKDKFVLVVISKISLYRNNIDPFVSWKWYIYLIIFQTRNIAYVSRSDFCDSYIYFNSSPYYVKTHKK